MESLASPTILLRCSLGPSGLAYSLGMTKLGDPQVNPCHRFGYEPVGVVPQALKRG